MAASRIDRTASVRGRVAALLTGGTTGLSPHCFSREDPTKLSVLRAAGKRKRAAIVHGSLSTAGWVVAWAARLANRAIWRAGGVAANCAVRTAI